MVGEEEFKYNDLRDSTIGVALLAVMAVQTGVIGCFFIIVFEQYNKYIKFWAWQMFFVSLPFYFAILICWIVTVSSSYPHGVSAYLAMSIIIFIYHFVIGIFLSFKAYRGARSGILFKVPVIGDFALGRARMCLLPPASKLDI